MIYAIKVGSLNGQVNSICDNAAHCININPQSWWMVLAKLRKITCNSELHIIHHRQQLLQGTHWQHDLAT